VEGAAVTSEGDWAGLIARSRGQSLKIKVIRSQKPIEIQVTTAKMRIWKVREVYAEPVFK
jgi:S1-C subfamily serine protease